MRELALGAICAILVFFGISFMGNLLYTAMTPVETKAILYMEKIDEKIDEMTK